MALFIMLFAGRMSSSEGYEGHDPIPGATQVQLHHQTSFVRLVDVGEANLIQYTSAVINSCMK